MPDGEVLDGGNVQPRATVYRAAEWRHKDVELAAHQLLQYLDDKTGLKPTRTIDGERDRGSGGSAPAPSLRAVASEFVDGG